MPAYTKVIEEMLVERGQKKGYYFVGDLTTKEILESMDLPVVKVNHNRVVQVVRTHYPKSSFENFSEKNGFVLHVRIRTK